MFKEVFKLLISESNKSQLSLDEWMEINSDKDPGPPVCEPPFCDTGGNIDSPTLPENEVYFFHPDHLGSTSYITNISGETVQFNSYLPFGETFVSQKRTSTISNYLFNSKEVDPETGLYYYGARYYNSRISTWLSVDPMWEETMAPYNYTYQNPVKYIDPTGMSPEADYYDSKGIYLGNDGVDDGKVYQMKDTHRAKLENSDVNWGGQLDQKHVDEIKAVSNDLGNIEDAFVTDDPVSDKRIQSLHPAIRMQATNFIKEANANSSGTLIRVAQGFRTYEEQNALFAKGRTTSGGIVTKAKGGESNHNFGLAFDIVGIKNGKVDYNLDWKSLSTYGKNNNLNWGGNWKSFKDKPHFENMFGNSLNNLRALPKDRNGLPILKK